MSAQLGSGLSFKLIQCIMSFTLGSTTAPAATGFTLGQPAAAPAAAATGFSFGSTAAAPAAAAGVPASTGFGFGSTAAPTTTANTGFGLGSTAAAPAAGGFSLGATPAQTSVAPATGLAFGATTSAAPTATAGGFSLGGTTTAATAAPTLSFGGANTAAAATTKPGLSFGATTSAAPTTGFGGFGAASTSTSTAGSTGFGGFGALGATTTTATGAITTTTPSLLGGGLGATPASTAATVGLGGTNVAPSIAGLGGNPLLGAAAAASSAASAVGGGSAGADGKNGPKALKEHQIPQELSQSVDEFKKRVKEERAVSSDIAHLSSKAHHQIQQDTEGLLHLTKSLSAQLAKHKTQLDQLKMEAAQELLNVEIAQRTRDTPPALQYENVAPYEYFSRLVAGFETQMLCYRAQIEETERHLQATMDGGDQALNVDDVFRAISKLTATFTNMAGRYSKLHESVQEHKNRFIQLHRHKYGTNTDLFQHDASRPSADVHAHNHGHGHVHVRVPTTVGPSPFTDQQDLLAMAKASYLSRPQGPAGRDAPPTFALNAAGGFPSWSAPAGGGGAAPSPFGALAAAASSPFSTNPLSSSVAGAASPFSLSATQQSTTGLLGSTMSPFGGASSQSPSVFQTGGKRGKH